MADRIGEFLITIHAITREQVDHVLRIQAGGDSRLFGEIALELRYLNDDAIKRYVDHMEKMKPREPGGAEPAEEIDG
jgi:hypothetical protein